ncbi:MAG: hypothetical protein RIS71_886, partial [Actinomycetota bacterium]
MATLSGQRAFITGGASGIGAEMARRFTREGAHVVVADVNDGLGKQVAVEVGGDFEHLDVTDRAAWDAVIAAHDPFDIVCLNAGVSTYQHVAGNVSNYPFEHLDDDKYERIMSINVDGVVHGARAVIPGMVARKTGHILVTASLAGIIAIPPDPIYGLTKHAMVGLVKSCPGFVDTPLVTDVTRDFIKAFSSDVLDVSIAGDLAMRALTERIAGSQWTVSYGHPIQQYVP